MKVRVPVNTTGFWIVWCPQDQVAPNRRFPTVIEARDAAEILARNHPGHSFYVMQPILNACVPERCVWPITQHRSAHA